MFRIHNYFMMYFCLIFKIKLVWIIKLFQLKFPFKNSAQNYDIFGVIINKVKI